MIQNDIAILKRVSLSKLSKYISKKLTEIRIEYTKVLRHGAVCSADEWLCDNFYLIEREGREIVKGLSGEKLPCDTESKNKLPVLFYELTDFILNCGCEITNETLGKRIDIISAKREMTISEFSCLSLLLRASLIYIASLGLKGDADDRCMYLRAAVKGLRNIEDIDFDLLMEQHCKPAKIFLRDPAGVYENMDEQSKHMYLSLLSKYADKRGKSETEAAADIVKKASLSSSERERHIGYYLMADIDRRRLGEALITAEIIIPLIFAIFVGIAIRRPLVSLIIFLPLWEALRIPIETIFMKSIKPFPLPRIETNGCVPESKPTLVTVSTLLPPAAKADLLRTRLTKLYHTNPDGAVYFCILADLKSSPVPHLPEDRTDIDASRKVICELNEKYGDRFFLIVRKRTFSKTQNEYTGWERKRGAIEQLIACIKGRKTEFLCFEGNKKNIRTIKYVLALDSDTGLLIDSVSEMVGAAIHPLNKPEIDKDKNIVSRGYGIIAPRVEVDLYSFIKTPFAKIMIGSGGISSYESTASERYQDFFGEGIFAGKGLIDIDAFYTVMSGRLPEEHVLSHDILESGFLRTGFMSDMQMTDGFPVKENSFNSRQHRWIRGDWQNIAFIGKHYRLNGKMVENPLSGLSRYKLIDNIRRAVTPVISLLCFIIAVFSRHDTALALCLSAIAGCIGGELFCAVRSFLSGGFSMLSRNYYSRAMPAALSSLIRAFINLCFLPLNAYMAFDACVRSLCRMLTGKKLLEWKTAADTENQTHKFFSHILHYMPSIVIGIVMLFPMESLLLRLIGIIFLLSVPISIISSRTYDASKNLLEKVSREKISSYAAAMWKYYDSLCGADENYLPPDNIQQTPVYRVAHRTSPTNIGLMMLSFLAARDLNFIDSRTLYIKLDNCLTTIEKLEKFEGHLLNWYDTRTLKPLGPRLVSTVDSGNFICSIVTLRQGINEYVGECRELSSIIPRLDAIENNTNFKLVYDNRRKLFRIAFDIENNELSPSCYDLLMSESRATGYYAIASRAVPKKHWGALGRTLVKEGRFTGCVSWTGTMFEYFMPNIFLPAYEGSLNYEALKFCIYCQKRRTRKKGIPWGISESGFYSFDSQLNYQYKAHGVQKLGLKRGLDSELVLSPYSSFLTLPFSPVSSMKNLKRFEAMKMTGRFGFYEAIDFTSKRLSGREYAIIRSFMTHHIGMSFLAACNAIKENIMQKRFMNDERMEAAAELLQEKIPIGAVVFSDANTKEIPNRPPHNQTQTSELDNINAASPHMHFITNGEWSLAVSDVGTSVSMSRGLDITRRSDDLLRRPQGVFAVAEVNGEAVPFTKAPIYGAEAEFTVKFADTYAAFKAKTDDTECVSTVYVHPQLPAEQRNFSVKNLTDRSVRVNLLIYLEPCLSSYVDDAAHPAFSKLFLQSEYHDDSKILVFKRKMRNGGDPVSLALGFAQNSNFEFDTARDKLLTSPFSLVSLCEAVGKDLKYNGYSPDPCAAFRFSFSLPAHTRKEFDLLMCLGSSPEEAMERIIEIRNEKAISASKSSRTLFKANTLESRLMSEILPHLFYSYPDCKEIEEERRNHSYSINDLWQMGISGDFPLILFEIKSKDDITLAVSYIKLHRSLKICGVMFDLVIFCHNIKVSVYETLIGILRSEDSESSLGTRAGIHIIEEERHGENILKILRYNAVWLGLTDKLSVKDEIDKYDPFEFSCVERSEDKSLGFEENGNYIINSPTPSPFCIVLANRTFGTLLSNNALGYTWAINSRENKLTPWYNDVASDNRGEILIVKFCGNYYDLCCGSTCEFSDTSAVYSGMIDSLKYRVTVTVPERGMQKYVEVFFENTSQDDAELCIAYYTEPVLGVNRKNARFIKGSTEDGVLFLQNDYHFSAKGYMYLYSDLPASYCCNRVRFLNGNWDEHSLPPCEDCCAAAINNVIVNGGSYISAKFTLGFCREKSAALSLRDYISDKPSFERNSIFVTTPDDTINYLINKWMPMQIFGSRIFGRVGFYQSGGAYGFRDQLQDVCSIITIAPEIAKYQILRAAAMQFEEGDVLHWFHILPENGSGLKGVRTRYSDDLLWLPYVVCEYVKKTGDYDILRTEIRFLKGEELQQGEKEKYFSPSHSSIKATLYEHCMRAINRSMRFGEHGIPLIGGGDWNDGFNNVGLFGKGESVWLGQFLSLVLNNMAVISEPEVSEDLKLKSESILRAIDENAWDGKWYIRAFFDSGASMGSERNNECKIDILTQSFSVLSNMPNHDRRMTALSSAMEQLVDEEYGVIRLFSPAFTGKGENPGYVASYPEGMRENGGQYTHAAVWMAMALYKENMNDEAYRLVKILNPALKYNDSKLKNIYMREPYALCGDVSYNPDIKGRGGWSLYTGAAGWYYRALTEELLGIQMYDGKIFINPHLPSAWKGYSAVITIDGAKIKVTVNRKGGGMTVDGKSGFKYFMSDGDDHNIIFGLDKM